MAEEINRIVLVERLIAYWKFHQGIANIADLAKRAQVSRDTVYRWLNGKALPRGEKLSFIKGWLDEQEGLK